MGRDDGTGRDGTSDGDPAWHGWAGDAASSWTPATFRLTSDALVVIRHVADGPATTVVALADVADLWAVEVPDGADPVVELRTGGGSAGRLSWPAQLTPTVVAALHRAHDRLPATETPATGRLDVVRQDRRLRRIASAVAVVMILGGLALFEVAAVYARVDRRSMDLPVAPDGVRTWLLLGSDGRAAARAMPSTDVFGTTDEVPGERADVVLVLQEGAGGRPPRLVSVPRDLLVFRPGHGVDRLALTFLDGPEATATSICRSLGVPVDHVVVIRFDGVRRLVDSVGGIDVDVERDTRDANTGLRLRAGPNRLDGAAAVAWVRSRHAEVRVDGRWVPDPGGDDGRQAHQRQLLGRLADRLAARARGPLSAHRVAWTLAGAIETDRATDPVDLARLAASLRNARDGGSLAHTTTAGAIPVARLSPRAQAQLDRLRNGLPDGPPCPRAHPVGPPG